MLRFVVSLQLNAAYKNSERLQPSRSEKKIARDTSRYRCPLPMNAWQLATDN
jgi:hypothetical protein